MILPVAAAPAGALAAFVLGNKLIPWKQADSFFLNGITKAALERANLLIE
jgi:hypothetical protein